MLPSSLVLIFSVFIFLSAAKAQRASPTPCPGVSHIRDCPTEGCGSGADPDLNKMKNKGSPDGSTATLETVQWMKELKNPRGADCRNREALQELGEGQMITVVAWALAARKGSPETCN